MPGLRRLRTWVRFPPPPPILCKKIKKLGDFGSQKLSSQTRPRKKRPGIRTGPSLFPVSHQESDIVLILGKRSFARKGELAIMSEAMTVETIVEAYWQMQGGYWTRLRYPFQTKKSGWSDIDILAYNPEKKILVIAESKVRGPKRDVYVYTKDSKKKYGDIFDFDYGVGYLSFLSHLKTVCSDGLLFSNFEKMVDKVV